MAALAGGERETSRRPRVGAGRDPADGVSTGTGERLPPELRRDRRAEIDALMRDLNTREAGQISRDFERMMPNAGGSRYSSLLVDGQPLQVRVSFGSTVVAATVPTDVNLQSTIAAAAADGIRVETAAVNVSTERLEAIARQLRAEQIRNGGRFQ